MNIFLMISVTKASWYHVSTSVTQVSKIRRVVVNIFSAAEYLKVSDEAR